MINNNIWNVGSFKSQFDTIFPVDECIIPHNKEKGIYDGVSQYLCLVIQTKYNGARLEIMTPYKWIGDESDEEMFKGQIGWGWTDGSNPIDNFENPIQDYDEFVMGWIKL